MADTRQELVPPAGNLTNYLTAQALCHPDDVAIDTIKGPVSFHSLESMTWHGATLLAKNGVRPGDVVGIAFIDECNLVIALLASARIGATAVSIPINTAVTRRRALTAESKARFLISDSADSAGLIPGFIFFHREHFDQDDAAIDKTVYCDAPAAPWLIIQGSGSTGHSRLIPVGHAQFSARRALYGVGLNLQRGDRLASLVSFSYAMSMQRGLEAISLGATLVLLGRAPMPRIADAGVTVLYATSIQAEALLRQTPMAGNPLLPGVRIFMLGSGVIPADLRKRIRQQITPNLYVYYATNESGLVTIASPADQQTAPETIGRTVAGVRLEIVDGNGNLLPSGKVGLIRVRSAALVSGYLDDDETNAERFTGQGFYPRDLGMLRQGGLLSFAGRSDDMMIMNGINIYPAEIESVMKSHPQVVDAKAFPLKHPLHQDIPVCVVVPSAESSLNERVLLQFAREHLGSHAPQLVFTIAELPRNEEGKVARPALMNLIKTKLKAWGTPGAEGS